MRNITQSIRWLMLMCLFIMGGVNSWAETVTFDFTKNSYGLPEYNSANNSATKYVTVPATITQDEVSITLNGNDNSSWRMWSDGLRAYKGKNASFTVSANGKTITAVSWTVVSGATFALDGTSINITEWTGDETEVKFVYTNTSSNIAVKTITVTYSDDEDLAESNFTLVGSTSLSFDLFDNKEAQVINYTTSSKGTVKVEGDGIDAVVDETAKTITVTPKTITNGEQTIKVTQAADDTYKSGTATFTVNVGPLSSKDKPYTVAQLLAMNSKYPDFAVYAKGIISEITEVSTQYGNATYSISDDGTTDNQFLVYRGYYLDNEKFTSDGQIQVGDKVVVYGTLVFYNSTTDEFNSGNYLVSWSRGDGKTYPTVQIDNTKLNVGETAIITTNGPAFTLTTSDEKVATVDGETVTAVAAGTAEITATWDEGTVDGVEYAAGSKTFNITVTPPFSIQDGVFDFGAGVNYGSGYETGSVKVQEGTWTAGNVTMVTAGRNCWYLATSGQEEGTTTLRLYKALTDAAAGTMEFSVPKGKVITKIEIEGTNTLNCLTTDDENYTVSSDKKTGTWTGKAKTVKFTATDTSVMSKITVTYEDFADPVVTLAESGYASYCCECPLDFSELDADVAAYYVNKVEGTTVAFEKIEGTIAAGVPFILYGTPKKECTLTLADASTETLDGNMLVGTLKETYVTTTTEDGATNYGLSGGYFKQIKEGVVPANKAYLQVPGGENAAALRIVFADGEATAIEAVESAAKNDGVYYNIAGQRVQTPTSGIYIVNGKKVLVK